MIELRHLDVRHFAIEECSHPANGCTAKWGCIGLIFGAIIVYINTTGFVSVYAFRVCDALVASCATIHLANTLSMKQNGHPMLNEGS